MPIPQYPDFKPLQKEDREEFERYYSKRPIIISDYTFSNFYIWRKLDKTFLTIINDNLCALVVAPDKKQYFMMPLGTNKIKETIIKCLEFSPKVVRADQFLIDAYLKGGKELKIEEDRDNFDYVYLTSDLVELKGRKYDAKRNHLNYFLRNHSHSFEELSAIHVKECISLNEKWCSKNNKESESFPNIECEGEVVKEALENFEYLGLKGGIIKVRGKIIAFSVGQQLTEDTAVIHIEKADPEIRGAAQIINREFVKNTWADMQYINREQDMGHAGLRKAKLSYYPVKFEKKFNLMLK